MNNLLNWLECLEINEDRFIFCEKDSFILLMELNENKTPVIYKIKNELATFFKMLQREMKPTTLNIDEKLFTKAILKLCAIGALTLKSKISPDLDFNQTDLTYFIEEIQNQEEPVAYTSGSGVDPWGCMSDGTNALTGTPCTPHGSLAV